MNWRYSLEISFLYHRNNKSLTPLKWDRIGMHTMMTIFLSGSKFWLIMNGSWLDTINISTCGRIFFNVVSLSVLPKWRVDSFFSVLSLSVVVDREKWEFCGWFNECSLSRITNEIKWCKSNGKYPQVGFTHKCFGDALLLQKAIIFVKSHVRLICDKISKI